MVAELRLPELGENVETGDLVKVLVSVGDTISRDQSVLELETDKATVEVPSSVNGKVTEILVKEGDTLKVGQLILKVEDGAGAKPPERIDKKEPALAPPVAEQLKAPEVAAPAAPKVAAAPVPTAPVAAPLPLGEPAPAAPSVRRQARELGIDINQVPGTGPAGRISAEDVTRYARQVISGAVTPRGGSGVVPGVAAAPLPDFTRWGEIERQPMKSIRRKTSEHLSYAWTTIPRVAQYDKADITQLEELRAAYGKAAQAAGGKLTLTVFALKVIATALKAFPQFAASLDVARGEIIYKKYCHIGIAVDTDRGLLVPVVRDVDKKNLQQLAIEVAQLAEKARNKKTAPEEMEGGVFSISNLGGIGGTGFSPIVNWPEVAILGIARASVEARYIDGQFQPRLMLPLSLSYDHRLIDGADAARFLRWVAEAFEEPFRLVVQG
jgi:pyruvate dehydrogenase E2 component (dihydrolipoamide acetyltransferase)